MLWLSLSLGRDIGWHPTTPLLTIISDSYMFWYQSGISIPVFNHEAFATTKWWLNYQANKVSMLVLNL